MRHDFLSLSRCLELIKLTRIKKIKNMDKRQKILIVDDSELNRDILKEILGETYNYLEAENGNQAIQMIGENIGIDLMLILCVKHLINVVYDQVYEKEENNNIMIRIMSNILGSRNSESREHILHIKTATEMMLDNW